MELFTANVFRAYHLEIMEGTPSLTVADAEELLDVRDVLCSRTAAGALRNVASAATVREGPKYTPTWTQSCGVTQ